MTNDGKPEVQAQSSEPTGEQPTLTRQQLSDQVERQLVAALREQSRALAQTAHAVHDRHTLPKADLGNRLARANDLVERSFSDCFGEIASVVTVLTPLAPAADEDRNIHLLQCIDQAVDVLHDINHIFEEAARTHRMSVPSELLAYTAAAKLAFGTVRMLFEQMKTAPW